MAKIFCVDDDALTLKFYQDFFRKTDEVYVTLKAEDILARLSSNPDLILTDSGRKRQISGYRLARAIREDPNPGFRKIPIIFYSGREASDDERSFFDRTILKGNVDELRVVVASFLRNPSY